MNEPAAFRWATPQDLAALGLDTDAHRLPKGGILLASDGSWLGFAVGADGCTLSAGGSESAFWAELVDRVLAQARKSKYRCATIDSEVPDGLAAALRSIGFEGEPLARPLFCTAPEDLQPYLDWKGRVTQVAFGKGSETLNARLYALIAAQLPSEGRFSEVEINRILNELHTYGDQSGLRRELVDRGYLCRTHDCRKYWKAPTPA